MRLTLLALLIVAGSLLYDLHIERRRTKDYRRLAEVAVAIAQKNLSLFNQQVEICKACWRDAETQQVSIRQTFERLVDRFGPMSFIMGEGEGGGAICGGVVPMRSWTSR